MTDTEISIDERVRRAELMRVMPDMQREPAIRGAVRTGVVVDARNRFLGLPEVTEVDPCGYGEDPFQGDQSIVDPFGDDPFGGDVA